MNRVICTTILQMIFSQRDGLAQDSSLLALPVVLCTEIAQGLGIMTACVPYLKPFLESLTSGVLDTNITNIFDTTDTQNTTQSTTRTQKLRSQASSSVIAARSTNPLSAKPILPLAQMLGPYNFAAVHAKSNAWDTGSTSSQAHIIKQTTSWAVDIELQTMDK